MNTTSQTARARAEFFGLRHLPFGRSRSASDFFLSASRQEALAFLDDRTRGTGVALLSGEPGVGKTTLVRSFLTTSDKRNPSVVITLPQDGCLNLLREVGKRFCLGIDDGADADQLIRQLVAALNTHASRTTKPLLIVDQAERLTQDSAPSLLALAQAASRGSLPLSIILVSSPVRSHSAQGHEFSLESCLSNRHTIASFDADESTAYVRSQITAAGGNADTLFETSALHWIHQHARGIPAEINAVASVAMRLAHRAGERTVRLAHIEIVARKRTRIQKSASKSEVMIGHPRAPRATETPARNRDDWHSVSLADVDASGCLDMATANALQSIASMPPHASADFPAHRAVAHGVSASPSEFSTQQLSEIGQGLDDLQQRADLLDSKSERIAALLDALDERIQRAEAATTRSTEAELRLRTIATNVADHTEALQDRISSLLAMSDSSEDAAESLRRARTSAESVLAAAHQRLSDAASACQKNMEHSGEQAAKLLADKSAALYAQMEQATLLIEERGPKFVRIAEHQIQDTIRESISKLTPIRAEMQGLLAESNVVLATTRTQLETEHQRAERCVEQIHSQAADGLIAVSTACQRAQAACDNLQKAAAKSDSSVACAAETTIELDRRRTDAKSTAVELARTTAAARRAGDTLSSLCLAVEEKDQQLTSHQAAARSLISQLTDAAIVAADAAKVLEEKRAAVRADIDHCEARLAQFHGDLSTKLQEAERKTASQFEELRSHAEVICHNAEERTATIAAALEQSASAAAAERTRLENQVAASVTASSSLHKAVSVAMDARAQMHASTEEALRQSTRLQETCQQAQAATSAAIETRTALADVEAKVTATMARLQADSQAAANKLAAELDTTLVNSAKEIRSTVHAAEAASQSLNAAIQKAQQSTGVLGQMAEASSRAVQSAVEKSHLSAADLERAAEAAKAQAAELQSSRCALIDSHRGLVLDAETLLNRVTMRLEAVKEMDGQLAEYDAAAESLRTHLTQLEEQLATATAAVSQPQRILADAQAYAGQLERVCDAAKKVKTSVSQAALAADERARDLTSAEQEAAQRLHDLRQDLSVAAQTLAQWVQEADRAQSRLASTIQTCPPIAKTHAKDALGALAKTAAQAGYVKPTARAHQQIISPASANSVPMIGDSQTPTREEEIAELLAEARKARKDVDGASRRPAPTEYPRETIPASIGEPASG